MNSTLELYRTRVMKPEQNWCFDDMTKFLAAYTTEYKKITDYQFLRPELSMSIKIDRTQNDSLLSNTRWDYLKVTINTSIYYFFITHIIQVSQNTLRLELKMDVLNTFQFSSTALSQGGNKYYLSKKSLITREHKNRFKLLSKDLKLTFMTDSDRDSALQFFNGSMQEEDKTPIFMIRISDIYNYCLQHGYFGFTFDDYDTQEGLLNIYMDRDGSKIQANGVSFNQNTIDLLDENGLPFEQYSYSSLRDGAYIGIQGDLTYLEEPTFVFTALGGSAFTDFFFDSNGDISYYLHFVGGFYNSTQRIVDAFQEGVETYLFKKPAEVKLLDADLDKTWYLLYTSVNDVVDNPSDTEATYVNPVNLHMLSDENITFSSNSASEVNFGAQDDAITDVKNAAEMLLVKVSDMSASGYIKVGGTTWSKSYIQTNYPTATHFGLFRKNNNDLVFDKVGLYQEYRGNTLPTWHLKTIHTIGSNIEYVTLYDIPYFLLWSTSTGDTTGGWLTGYNIFHDPVYTLSAGSTSSGDVYTWKQMDTTNSKYIKAINLPYCPSEFFVGLQSVGSYPSIYTYNSTEHTIQLKSVQNNDFDRIINFGDTNPLSPLQFYFTSPIAYNTARNMEYESKLFHSDFYLPKFVYDSYSFPFNLENVDVEALGDLSEFLVRYVVSSNVLSKFMFQFNQYICKRESQDYYNVLIIDRNNEKALFNNAYVNYIKNGGYSYDTKKANSQNAINGIMTALSIVGAVASFASTPASGGMGIAGGIGLTLSAAGSVIRNIYTAQEQDRAISQKMLQLQNQSTAVSGTEDIDILRAFSGNKAKLVLYEPSEIMKKALWDLFYYCGYATHEQKIPDITSRSNFNFVQGEVIIEDYNFSDEFADEIKLRWKEGITFFHVMPNNFYDIKFEYENFETFLLEE